MSPGETDTRRMLAQIGYYSPSHPTLASTLATNFNHIDRGNRSAIVAEAKGSCINSDSSYRPDSDDSSDDSAINDRLTDVKFSDVYSDRSRAHLAMPRRKLTKISPRPASPEPADKIIVAASRHHYLGSSDIDIVNYESHRTSKDASDRTYTGSQSLERVKAQVATDYEANSRIEKRKGYIQTRKEILPTTPMRRREGRQILITPNEDPGFDASAPRHPDSLPLSPLSSPADQSPSRVDSQIVESFPKKRKLSPSIFGTASIVENNVATSISSDIDVTHVPSSKDPAPDKVANKQPAVHQHPQNIRSCCNSKRKHHLRLAVFVRNPHGVWIELEDITSCSDKFDNLLTKLAEVAIVPREDVKGVSFSFPDVAAQENVYVYPGHGECYAHFGQTLEALAKTQRHTGVLRTYVDLGIDDESDGELDNNPSLT